MGLDHENGRPEKFIWTAIPIPPVCIRPSIAMTQENGSNEDDLTVKLSEIVYTNTIIKNALQNGSSVNLLMEDWDFLQLQCAIYVNSELPGIPLAMQTSTRPIRGLCQRLKGKAGRFRGNLSGKRVDFSSRTVISPDPNLKIDEIGVPIYVAKNLTYPEKVSNYNLERMRQCVINGPEKHPGANYIVQGTSGFKKYLKYGDRAKLAVELQVGDVVERHMIDGDVVLFNRQPSLHKLSIMAHFAKIKPWRTFRFNECVCAPYNADFDGDEMNLHLPQTEEARSEAIELMGVKNNLVTPRNGQPLIAATQDFITASFLLSQKDVFLTRAQFCQICCYMCDADLQIDIPEPTVIKPIRLWTGKQVFSVLFRPNATSPIIINLEAKTRTFTKTANAKELCPNDGYLVVRNSELLSGVLDKSNIGGESKNSSIFYVIMRDYGNEAAAIAMTRLSKLCARYLGTRGFSIGINDVQPSSDLQTQKEELVQEGYKECDQNIADYKMGKLENQPGCNAEQSLEAVISKILSKIRDDVGQICLQELSKFNAPLIMQACGSKGSKINVSQMVACVGQQIISGSRIPDGFVNRSLPHFFVKSKIPAAKGFVSNSFYSGLTPTEFFFHAVSGREGLVDTAVKTAETGYMQRRLMKALEDLSSHYDYSVRNSSGGIVQFKYGDDTLDPTNMEGEGIPVDFERNLLHVLALVSESDYMTVEEVRTSIQQFMNTETIQKNCSAAFIRSVVNFIEKSIVSRIESGKSDFVNSRFNITNEQLDSFYLVCYEKYLKSKIEPGTAVGAVGAQSIGEPGTQMTLKTFHFAGVASMNITLGVPRIKEIINASKAISTPIITAKLCLENNVRAARIVKGRVENTTLGDIAECIEEIFGPDDCHIKVKINMNTVLSLQLEVDLYSIEQSITRARKLKISSSQIFLEHPDTIRIVVPPVDQKSLYFQLQHLRRALPEVVVKGVSSVSRAVINTVSSGKYNLLVEGYGLREVMTTEGVDGIHTTSNHIAEIEKVLGIEAARQTIANEIQYTMGKHGMTIDSRHVMLLADTMTYKGQVLGITRFGISKMKDSVLMLASFEKTTDHLFDAALFGKKDNIDGVSECIIMGVPMPVGTGIFKVLQKMEQPKIELKNLLFDYQE